MSVYLQQQQQILSCQYEQILDVLQPPLLSPQPSSHGSALLPSSQSPTQPVTPEQQYTGIGIHINIDWF